MILLQIFEQQKTVYETEADMLKNETEEQIKRSLASHAIHFQQRQNELEETFKAREAALEGNIEHKKRFLWGLAKALRTQHAQMTSAMQAVRAETKRLAEREQSLKAQLTEAEEMLKQRGEDMRKQIADELAMLEEHLESMKSERDSLNRERIELDTRKSQSDNKIVNVKVDNNMKTHYELLKEELILIKNYLEGNREPKCIERSTITDISNVNSKINLVMNNEMGWV
ncbi:uncharacterized protein [Choristoneura fumiferana]|uniref:uncharacterized protein n=1 Tax=Choristoneura fumiferana TaxID=7141 RepID=UPI003D1599B6